MVLFVVGDGISNLMWLQFTLTVVISAALLYVPGCLIFSALKRLNLAYATMAPLVSVLSIECLAIAYGLLGIPCSPLTVLCGIGAMVLVALVASRSRNCLQSGFDCFDFRLFALYLFVGAVVAFFVFVLPLDGPESFNQDHDNVTHLNIIRSYMETRIMSPLHVSAYSGATSSPVGVVDGFYPSAWHCIAALSGLASGSSPVICINALNYVIIGVVIPASCFFLNSVLFGEKRRIIACGAVSSLAFVAFPWGLLSFGPLYANLFGLALCPLLIGAVIEAPQIWKDGKDVCTLLLIGGFVAVSLAHTNAIFTTGVILAPFLIARFSRFQYGSLEKLKPIKKAVLALCAIAALWVLAFNLPFLQGVVQFEWPPRFDAINGFLALLTCALGEMPAQSILALFIVLGCVVTSVHNKNRWLVCSLVLCGVLLFSSTSTDGFLRHFLSGFWYTDPYRLAANFAICATPLLAVGIDSLISVFLLQGKGRLNEAVITVAVLLGFTVLNYCSINTISGLPVDGTPFSKVESRLETLNNRAIPNLVAPEERSFLDRSKDIVGDDLVLNCPEDGSMFAYGLNGMNVYFRSPGIVGKNGLTDVAASVKQSLYLLGSDPALLDELDSLGAKYVLLLDLGGEITADRHTYGYYDPDEWAGFNKIDDSTPGLKVVLSEGDMRLYEIDYASFS